ncbi:rRNA maturation RNase YbeY [Candidatus Parcubacteria bacterium]|nr:rRNA maturation RNase YbeY [Candidatus Parcubacteria bacterium]
MIYCDVNKAAAGKIKKVFIKNIVLRILKYLSINNANISVALVSGADIKKLNKKYRDKNSATDVLSFCYCKKPLDGEIIICYNEALKQAKAKNHRLEQEITLLLAHSLLHLIGYDHKNNREELEMKKLENIILSKIKKQNELF